MKTVFLTMLILIGYVADAATYAIGPGKKYPDIITYRNASGSPDFTNLQPGDIVEIYPNIINGVNSPYETGSANFSGNIGGMHISSNGTKDAPIIIRGIPDANGRRPILERDRVYQNIISINGNYIILENLVVDGGIREFLEWMNAKSKPGNRFNYITNALGQPLSKPLFDKMVTYENLHTFLKTKITVNTVNGPVSDILETIMTRNIPTIIDAKLNGVMSGGTITISQHQLFSRRGIFHESGNFLTVRNCLVTGCGTGLTSADTNGSGSNGGPGSSLIEYNEFGYNGQNGAGHNIYMNGDNSLYKDLIVMFKNNFVHHAVRAGCFGFRTRVGHTIVQNNFFLNNGARQMDMVGTSVGVNDIFIPMWRSYFRVHNQSPPDDWWWADRFGFRQNGEVIGNVFVNTPGWNFGGIRIGGGTRTDEANWMEESFGRYRFVNNTFVNLSPHFSNESPRSAIETHFGVESVEMYNNIFYTNNPNPHCFIPFWDMMNPAQINEMAAEAQTIYAVADAAGTQIDQKWLNDDGLRFKAGGSGESNANIWRFGIRQVAGANNWVSYGALNNRMNGGDSQIFGGVPFEWQHTVYGTPGENPFMNLSEHDYRIRENSTAAQMSNIHAVPVGYSSDFITQAEYNALLSAGKLPKFNNYKYIVTRSTTPPDARFPDILYDVKFQKTTWNDPSTHVLAPWLDLHFPNPQTTNPSSPLLKPVIGAMILDQNGNMLQKYESRTDSAKPTAGAYLIQ